MNLLSLAVAMLNVLYSRLFTRGANFFFFHEANNLVKINSYERTRTDRMTLKWFYPLANNKNAVHTILILRCTSVNYDHLHMHLDHLALVCKRLSKLMSFVSCNVANNVSVKITSLCEIEDICESCTPRK